MSTLQCIMVTIILVLAAIMAVAEMWTGYSVPVEFWAVLYAVLGFMGIPVVSTLAGKVLKKVGKALKE